MNIGPQYKRRHRGAYAKRLQLNSRHGQLLFKNWRQVVSRHKALIVVGLIVLYFFYRQVRGGSSNVTTIKPEVKGSRQGAFIGSNGNKNDAKGSDLDQFLNQVKDSGDQSLEEYNKWKEKQEQEKLKQKITTMKASTQDQVYNMATLSLAIYNQTQRFESMLVAANYSGMDKEFSDKEPGVSGQELLLNLKHYENGSVYNVAPVEQVPRYAFIRADVMADVEKVKQGLAAPGNKTYMAVEYAKGQLENQLDSQGKEQLKQQVIQQKQGCFDRTGMPYSKYCSTGSVTRGIIGNLDVPQQAQQIVDGRSYKGEIIMTSSDSQHYELMLNMVFNLYDFGIEHYVVFMHNQTECQSLMEVLPEGGCVWSDFMGDQSEWAQLESFNAKRRLWMLRWLVLVRFLQYKLNVFMMDTDVVMLQDPYQIFKSPQLLAGYHMITSQEGSIPGINCGITYVQNASPVGAVAWAAAEVAERTLRFLEEPGYLFKRNPSWFHDDWWLDMQGVFEQSLFNDAVCSGMAARPLFMHSLGPHPRSGPKYNQWQTSHKKLCAWKAEQTKYVGDQQALSKLSSDLLLWSPISIPPPPKAWPVALGGFPYPSETRSTFSSRIRPFLEAHGPVFPDQQYKRDIQPGDIAGAGGSVRRLLINTLNNSDTGELLTRGLQGQGYRSRDLQQQYLHEGVRVDNQEVLSDPQLTQKTGGEGGDGSEDALLSKALAPPGKDDSGGESLVVRAPYWLFSRWSPSGTRGGWNVKQSGIPSAVMVHSIVPQGRDGVGKLAVLKVYGWWHWDIARVLYANSPRPPAGVVRKLLEGGGAGEGATAPPIPRTSTGVPGKGLGLLQKYQGAFPNVQPVNGTELPRLLTLHPSVQPVVGSIASMWKMAMGLMLAASVSGRVFVWPPISCISSNIVKQQEFAPIHNGWPSPIWDPTVVTSGSINNMRCYTTEFMSKGCENIGMQYYEFEHYAGLYPDIYPPPDKYNHLLSKYLTNTKNTAFKPGMDMVKLEEMSFGLEAQPLLLASDKLVEKMADLEEEGVVYFGQPFFMVEAGQQQQALDAILAVAGKCTNPGHPTGAWDHDFQVMQKQAKNQEDARKGGGL